MNNMTKSELEGLPQGSIVGLDNEYWYIVALKVATFEWAVTGNPICMKSSDLLLFGPEWELVRLGNG